MKIIAGNWKMNGSATSLSVMLDALGGVKTNNRVVICVPFTMLRAGLGGVLIGAQDVSAHDAGAFTGEVSAKMIADTGATHVIVGHSERRQNHGETNDTVRAKASRAMAQGLVPIICVGETWDERQDGKTMDIIESGVRESVPNDANGDIIVAYEPRWAIGAGVTPTAEEITQAHGLVAKTLESIGRGATPILYGASVNGANASEIMSLPNVDGVLVGGASLKSDSFISIITSME